MNLRRERNEDKNMTIDKKTRRKKMRRQSKRQDFSDIDIRVMAKQRREKYKNMAASSLKSVGLNKIS